MSNNIYIAKETSFWNFIKENEIEIPIIQRDYAQGRLGKEYLRKSFLADIKNALDNGNKSKMKLDFVYGSVENDKMSPLDGQQRLTTLWLLHWYIAFMSGNLNEDVCKTLAKFKYETRISSREFCENLCKPENFTDYEKYKSTKGDRKVVEYITSRTWFYSAWKQDPTIQSMLRMLGGTEINDKKSGEDIVDGLEEVFKNTDFAEYWNRLTSDDAPIVFYQLPLENFGLSDDLYIKMNARGKQLTSFENFKADLVGYIRRVKQKNNETEEDEKKEGTWSYLLSAENGIPIKMDTTWTDIFWKKKSDDNRIDEIYFAFLNRFFLCELICQKEKDDYLYAAKKLEEENSTFKYLYGKESNDANIEYVGWEKYGDIPLPYFNDLDKVLDNLIDNIQEFFPEWAKKNSQFQFIPKYKEDNAITTLTQSERVVFHAISKYLQVREFDETSFRQWMRVVWNIVENAGIETVASMIGAMRLIDELSEHAHNIYPFLACYHKDIKSTAAQDQVQEEIAKAKMIVENPSWENKLKNAEKNPYLLGKIWVLFPNDNVTTLETFEARYNLLRSLIDNNEDKYHLLKVLLSRYQYDKPHTKLELKRSSKNWKKLITKDLSQCFIDTEKDEIIDSKFKYLEYLTKTMLLNKREEQNDLNLKSYGDKVVLFGNPSATWRSYNNVILDKMHCDNQLLQEFPSDWSIKIDNKDIYIGEQIDFRYGNVNRFRWHTNGYVYLISEQGKCWPRPNPKQIKDRTEEEEYYCFKVTDCDNTEFATRLDCLISQQQADDQGGPCYENSDNNPVNI